MTERSRICWETLPEILTAAHRRKYPDLASALAAIDGMVGLPHVKETLCDQLLNILAFDQLYAPNRTAPAVTRARSRSSVGNKQAKRTTKTKWTRRKRRKTISTVKGTANHRTEGIATADESTSLDRNLHPHGGDSLSALLMASMADGGDTDEEEDEDEPIEAPIRPKHLADMNLHVLLCGPSGCGKSTLARHIARLYEAMGVVNGAFTTISRASVISRFQGASSERIHGIIRKHQNGETPLKQLGDSARAHLGEGFESPVQVERVAQQGLVHLGAIPGNQSHRSSA